MVAANTGNQDTQKVREEIAVLVCTSHVCSQPLKTVQAKCHPGFAQGRLYDYIRCILFPLVYCCETSMSWLQLG